MSESQDWAEFGVTKVVHDKEKVVLKKHRNAISKGSPESKALHKAFAKHIEETYTPLDCFNEYTLDRNEYGTYTNMSVRMDFPQFIAGWNACKKFLKSVRFKKE